MRFLDLNPHLGLRCRVWHLYFFFLVSDDKGAQPDLRTTGPVQNYYFTHGETEDYRRQPGFQSKAPPSIPSRVLPSQQTLQSTGSGIKRRATPVPLQMSRPHRPTRPGHLWAEALALRWTNLSQNRQGVCCLWWGRSASFSSSQAASSPLSDSSGRSSSSSKAPRPPSTRKRSDLLRMPVRTRRTKSREKALSRVSAPPQLASAPPPPSL